MTRADARNAVTNLMGLLLFPAAAIEILILPLAVHRHNPADGVFRIFCHYCGSECAPARAKSFPGIGATFSRKRSPVEGLMRRKVSASQCPQRPFSGTPAKLKFIPC